MRLSYDELNRRAATYGLRAYPTLAAVLAMYRDYPNANGAFPLRTDDDAVRSYVLQEYQNARADRVTLWNNNAVDREISIAPDEIIPEPYVEGPAGERIYAKGLNLNWFFKGDEVPDRIELPAEFSPEVFGKSPTLAPDVPRETPAPPPYTDPILTQDQAADDIERGNPVGSAPISSPVSGARPVLKATPQAPEAPPAAQPAPGATPTAPTPRAASGGILAMWANLPTMGKVAVVGLGVLALVLVARGRR